MTDPVRWRLNTTSIILLVIGELPILNRDGREDGEDREGNT
jgi:hypothetical protein